MITAETPSSDAFFDFTAPAGGENGEGLCYTHDSENDITTDDKTEDIDNDGYGERVYYYRGTVTNNNVVFGGFCWLIIRTNEDGTVRLIYNNEPIIDNDITTCTQPNTASIGIKTNSTAIASIQYNSFYSDIRYVGYMYGNSCDTIEHCEENINDSTIKETLERWYEQRLITYDYMVADEVFCNDRSSSDGNDPSSTYKYYDVGRRTTSPTYKCPNMNDRFTVSNTIGNGMLEYPIALLSLDELRMSEEDAGFLNASTTPYFTMSPNRFYSKSSQVACASPAPYTRPVHNSLSAVPVISLISNTRVASGTGIIMIHIY